MAKESGMGMALAVDDHGGSARTISNDVTSLDFGIPRGVQDITGINSSAVERLLLLADFTITINGVFNDASNLSHAVFSTVSSTSVTRTVTITISSNSLPNETIFTDYALSRSATGEANYTASGSLNSTTVPTWA
jgi:hypothetical protein